MQKLDLTAVLSDFYHWWSGAEGRKEVGVGAYSCYKALPFFDRAKLLRKIIIEQDFGGISGGHSLCISPTIRNENVDRHSN